MSETTMPTPRRAASARAGAFTLPQILVTILVLQGLVVAVGLVVIRTFPPQLF